jgi:nitrogen PTS system EIIA component
MDLTAKDAARMLNIPESQVHSWIRNGTLPSYRVKDRYRLNRVELLEWAAARGMKVAPEFFHDSHSADAGLLLTDALTRGGILYDVACNDKSGALKAACDLLKLPAEIDREELLGVLLAREALCSTGIGNGVAIPHPRGPIVLGLESPLVALAFPRQPIEYGAIDGRPVSILFVIISTTVRIHLTLLSHLMFALQDPELRGLLDRHADAPTLLAKFSEIERRVVNANHASGKTP